MDGRGRRSRGAKQADKDRPVTKTRLRLGEVRRHPPEVDLTSEAEINELLPDPGVEEYLQSLEGASLCDPQARSGKRRV